MRRPEQRQRFARDEDQDAEDGDDDGEAAERDDEHRGAIDAPQTADPLGRGRHLARTEVGRFHETQGRQRRPPARRS